MCAIAQKANRQLGTIHQQLLANELTGITTVKMDEDMTRLAVQQPSL
jgi:hypothetical protein